MTVVRKLLPIFLEERLHKALFEITLHRCVKREDDDSVECERNCLI